MGPREPIAFDSETELIRPGVLAPRLVCLSIAEGEDAELVHHTSARPWVEGLLKGDRILVGHNVAYDFGVIAAAFPDLLPDIFAAYDADRVTDTKLRESLQHLGLGVYRGFDSQGGKRIKLGYSLGELAKRRLGLELEKDGGWRLRYGELRDVPLERWPEAARHYAITDAVATLRLFRDQEAERVDLLVDEFRQARAAWWLHLMACWGLTTDPAGVREFTRRTQQEYDRVEAELQAAGLIRANGVRDTKATKARVIAVCATKGIPIRVTKTKQPKLDADTLENLGDPLLEKYATISSLKKKLSTDVKLLERGLIQPRFDLVETGRTSSSPNVQNLPRKGGVRECFVPRPGFVYAAADYSGFELRTVSQVILNNGWRSKLAEALNAGFDPHLELARRILRIPYDEAKARIHEDEVDLARQTGKVGNFGFPGGLGIVRFVHFARKQYGVILTEKQAIELKRYWLQAWPEFDLYFRWVGDQCNEAIPTVRQLYSGRVRANVSFTEACNSYFQGLAADAAKAAGFLIARECYTDTSSPLFGSRPCNFVHDEFILETPDNAGASAAAERLAELMVIGAKPWLPDLDVVAEPYLMRRWSKKAKPIRNELGELVPWDLAA